MLRIAGHAAPTTSALVVALVFGEPARRPVRLRRVAAARAVERGHVLEWNEDVAVELDVRDVVDRAVRSEHAVLVVAVHQRDLDLLPLVLARVVLHRGLSLSPRVGRAGAAPRRASNSRSGRVLPGHTRSA